MIGSEPRGAGHNAALRQLAKQPEWTTNPLKLTSAQFMPDNALRWTTYFVPSTNRLVGILHGCLKTATLYNEATAWSHHVESVAA
jgi:hypothetical protein